VVAFFVVASMHFSCSLFALRRQNSKLTSSAKLATRQLFTVGTAFNFG